MFVRVCVCACVCACVCMCLCVCLCACVCMCLCVCLCVYVCVCSFSYIHEPVYVCRLMCMYIRTYVFHLRAFSNNVSTNNTDSLGRSYRVIPIVVELRPRLPPNNLTLAGFLVRPNEVNPAYCVAYNNCVKCVWYLVIVVVIRNWHLK